MIGRARKTDEVPDLANMVGRIRSPTLILPFIGRKPSPDKVWHYHEASEIFVFLDDKYAVRPSDFEAGSSMAPSRSRY